MRRIRILSASTLVLCGLSLAPQQPAFAQSVRQGNELLLERVQQAHGLSDGQMDAMRAVFLQSEYIGQGNPAITRHPMSQEG